MNANDDLVQRLLSAESDFLVALESGAQMLASYNQSWSALLDVLHTASKTGSVSHEALSLTHSVASRISNIARCYLHVKHEEKGFSAQLRIDFDAMLHQMDALTLNAKLKSSHSNSCLDTHSLTCLPTPTLDAGSSHPTFIASAYQWLLGNLHNPYPTAELKAQIATASSCQVTSVNSWFINARRRIGWTTLCRERFSNCRADMMDAAYRALVQEDPQRTLSLELRHSFITIKVAAESLYSSTFTRSALAGDLDGMVRNVTEEDRESIEIRKRCRVERANFAKAARDSYPSPGRSVTTSPLPALFEDSLTSESEEEKDVASPIVAGSKRRRSSIEPVNQPSFARRPIKRLRASTTSQTCLPSPPSSIDGINAPSSDGLLELSSIHSMPPDMNKLSPSRKRRLSDADAIGISKRPRTSMAISRLHVVSDPLPRPSVENECSVHEWFNANFDALFAIPPPVDATEPDFAASWEVELFRDYNIPGNPKPVPKCPSAPTADTQIFAPTDLSDFDSLLQSIGGTSYTASSIPNILQPNIDWTSLLNDLDAYQPAICSTLPQCSIDSQPLSEIDLSMLQLPPVVPAVNSQGDFTLKQAKLQQLHAMQEAVRQMEQELQAEGVVV